MLKSHAPSFMCLDLGLTTKQVLLGWLQTFRLALRVFRFCVLETAVSYYSLRNGDSAN